MYPVGATIPGADQIDWWVEYTVMSEGPQPSRGATPKVLRRTLAEALRYAEDLRERRHHIRDDIAIYPVDLTLREPH